MFDSERVNKLRKLETEREREMKMKMKKQNCQLRKNEKFETN